MGTQLARFEVEQGLGIVVRDGGVLSVRSHAGALKDHGRYDLWIATAFECPPPTSRADSDTLLWVPLDDRNYDWRSGEGKNACERIGTAAVLATMLLKRQRAVLVSCHMGLNRSAVVAAVTLRMLGASPGEAVRLIKVLRGPDSLTNPSFLRLVAGNQRSCR